MTPCLVLLELHLTDATDEPGGGWPSLATLHGHTWSARADAERPEIVDVHVRVESEEAGQALATALIAEAERSGIARRARLIGVPRVL